MAEVTAGQATFLSALETIATLGLGIYSVEKGGNLPTGFTNPVVAPTAAAPVDASKSFYTIGIIAAVVAGILLIVKK